MLALAGEQISQVFGVHVESIVVGNGGCCHYGDCLSKWTGTKASSFHLTVFLAKNTYYL